MQQFMETLIHRFVALQVRAEDGATSVEYAMIAALIAGVIVLAVTAVGVKTGANFSKITDLMK